MDSSLWGRYTASPVPDEAPAPLPPKAPSRASKRRRLLRLLTLPLVYSLLTMAVFWRLWTPIHGAERSWKYDPPHDYWGDLVFQQKTLAQGELAMWNPYDRGGFPVYGDPQPGMFYPPNWPLLFWGSMGKNLPFSIASFKIIAHWIFGAIGMHLLLRRIGGGRKSWEPACYVAGILFSFTSPKLRYMGSALNWSVAWLPWVLLTIWYFSEKPSPRRGVIMGSTLAMVLLAGAPAVVLYALILALPLGLYRMWGRLREHWKSIALGALTTVLWVLPLVASNLQQVPESVRQVRSYDFITGSAFTLGHLLTFIVPMLGQGENPYIGGLALLAIGLAIASRKQWGLVWVFLGAAAFAAAIALGNHAPFLPSLASAVPPFSLFRQAHRYLYATSAALSIVAGLGFAYVINIEAEERKKQLARALAWVGGALSFALGIAYLISVVMQDKIASNKNEAFGLAFLSVSVFTVLLRVLLSSRAANTQRIAWVIAALVFLDVWSGNFRTYDVGMTSLPTIERDGKISNLEGLDKEWRVYDDGFLQYRPGPRLGIRDFSGYEGDPLGLSRYVKLLDACKRAPKLLGHANVRYLLSHRGKINVTAAGGTLLAPGIWELPKTAPAVYYVANPLTASDAEDSLRKLRSFDPGENAVVEGAFTAHAPFLGGSVGHIRELTPNRVVAEIETPGPGLIVVEEAYYSQWSATLDGAAVDISPANLMFRGIPVASKGVHRIVMTLSPKRFWWLLPAYVLALALLLWAGVWPSVRRRWT